MPEKYQREIEEIVSKAGSWRAHKTLRRSLGSTSRQLWQRGRMGALQTSQLVTPSKAGVTGVLLLIGGLAASKPVIIIIAVGVLLAAFLLAIARGRGTFQETTGYDRSWRGHPLEPREPSGRRGGLWRHFAKKR